MKNKFLNFVAHEYANYPTATKISNFAGQLYNYTHKQFIDHVFGHILLYNIDDTVYKMSWQYGVVMFFYVPAYPQYTAVHTCTWLHVHVCTCSHVNNKRAYSKQTYMYLYYTCSSYLVK